jgi:aminobenzoyl-glutamate utilization protein B
MHDILPNLPMIDLVHRHMEARPPEWTDEEQAFARACQREMGLPEAGLATQVLPKVGPTKVGGSSDLGDISKVTPLGVFGWPTAGPRHIAAHLGDHRLRRHVDRRPRLTRQRADPCRSRV